MASRAPTGLLRVLGNIWLPYLGAGIKILELSNDYRYVRVCLKRSWYNGNYVGTQFGGSIYAMTDPFYMLMLINNLGRDYIVWDKAAQIQFLKPGRSTLFAEFKIDDQLLDLVRSETAEGEKYVFSLPVDVKDEDQNVVARIEKTIYVRKKPTKGSD